MRGQSAVYPYYNQTTNYLLPCAGYFVGLMISIACFWGALITCVHWFDNMGYQRAQMKPCFWLKLTGHFATAAHTRPIRSWRIWMAALPLLSMTAKLELFLLLWYVKCLQLCAIYKKMFLILSKYKCVGSFYLQSWKSYANDLRIGMHFWNTISLLKQWIWCAKRSIKFFLLFRKK